MVFYELRYRNKNIIYFFGQTFSNVCLVGIPIFVASVPNLPYALNISVVLQSTNVKNSLDLLGPLLVSPSLETPRIALHKGLKYTFA